MKISPGFFSSSLGLLESHRFKHHSVRRLLERLIFVLFQVACGCDSIVLINSSLLKIDPFGSPFSDSEGEVVALKMVHKTDSQQLVL